MKKFKKFVLALLLLSLTSALFAAEFDFNNAAYTALNTPFTKTSARIMSMGGAGLAAQSDQDALYINPASLGAKGIVFNMPNAAVTLYNIKKGYVESGIAEELINNPSAASDQDFLVNNVMGGVLDMLSTAGKNKLATIDAGVGTKLGRFALGVDAQVNLNTYLEPGHGTIDIQIIPQVDVAATLGLGLRFFRNSPINLDVGVSAQLNVRAFMSAVDASTVLDAMSGDGEEGSDPMSFLNNSPLAYGWAIPLTFGANLNLPLGFSISGVVSNFHLLNGGYNYVVFDNYEAFLDDPMTNAMAPMKGSNVTTIKSDMIVSAGFAWNPDLGGFNWLIKPTLAVDVVDVLGLFSDFSMNSMFSRTKAGLEVEVFKAFELRAGLNAGYASVGAGFNLFNLIHVEASYYWNEFGTTLGEKDVDALTIRFNIGWER